MCIALFSNAHPKYALILINNRDEFLNRPTAAAHWWDGSNGNVLGGRDLMREEQGTWLGVTKQGRLAILTNFREEGVVHLEAKSRGGLVNAFLTQPDDDQNGTETFVQGLVTDNGLKGVGGFNLACGRIGEPLAVISNRTPDVEGISWIAGDREQTIGLSNAAFADRSWPKVLRGEELLSSLIERHSSQDGSQASLIEDLFEVMSDDTLPKKSKGVSWQSYVMELRKSIFIPAISGEGTDETKAEDLAAAKGDQSVRIETKTGNIMTADGHSGPYGTQKQTVVLVDHQGKVTFVERTLYDATGRATSSADRDRTFTFNIEA